MKFEGLALPMRCQPPHYGHVSFIVNASRVATQVRVFLSREVDSRDNPFSLDTRRRWLQEMLKEYSLINVEVVDRLENPPPNKKDEYHSTFDAESIVVITTHETDEMYKKMGFQTLNHHLDESSRMLHGEIPERIHSTGRIIRQKLLSGSSCAGYIPQWLEEEARVLLQNSSTF